MTERPTYQACRCCNAQLTKNEVHLRCDRCLYCAEHNHTLGMSSLQGDPRLTSCGMPTPADWQPGPPLYHKVVTQPDKATVIIGELRDGLRIARQYVAATHGSLVGAVGQDNVVSPDLATIDNAIARAGWWLGDGSDTS